MLHIQLLNNTGGTAISSLSVGSGQTVTTEGIDISRAKKSGILLVVAGTVISFTRQVSLDNVTYYTPYDINDASLGIVTSTTQVASKFITLDFANAGSSAVVAPWERFNVTMLSGGTLGLTYVQEE